MQRVYKHKTKRQLSSARNNVRTEAALHDGGQEMKCAVFMPKIIERASRYDQDMWRRFTTRRGASRSIPS